MVVVIGTLFLRMSLSYSIYLENAFIWYLHLFHFLSLSLSLDAKTELSLRSKLERKVVASMQEMERRLSLVDQKGNTETLINNKKHHMYKCVALYCMM